MSSGTSSDPNLRPGQHPFTTTHWSLVIAAQGSDSVPAGLALARLCETYWYPLYAFVRRRGYNSHDAQDLTQSFFEKLLEKNYLSDVIRERGKFRSFLLGSLKHFLANEWDRSRAAKRGGGTTSFSLDDAEARFKLEPADNSTAEHLYERRWAMTILDTVMSRLREEMGAGGKEAIFEALKGRLSGGDKSDSFAKVATRLGISEGTARVTAHRLKKQYREILRQVIGETVAEPSEIDGEIRYLIGILGGEKTN